MSFNPQFQKVGDILVYHNVITEDQLQKALSEQKETNEKLGQILINQDVSDLQDADLATLVTSLQSQLTSQEASQKAFINISKLNLFDFIG